MRDLQYPLFTHSVQDISVTMKRKYSHCDPTLSAAVNAVASKLRAARLKYGISGREVARRANVNHMYTLFVEDGRASKIGREPLLRILAVYRSLGADIPVPTPDLDLRDRLNAMGPALKELRIQHSEHVPNALERAWESGHLVELSPSLAPSLHRYSSFAPDLRLMYAELLQILLKEALRDSDGQSDP